MSIRMSDSFLPVKWEVVVKFFFMSLVNKRQHPNGCAARINLKRKSSVTYKEDDASFPQHFVRKYIFVKTVYIGIQLLLCSLPQILILKKKRKEKQNHFVWHLGLILSDRMRLAEAIEGTSCFLPGTYEFILQFHPLKGTSF